MVVSELIFVVEDDPEGGYVAKALGESIFTQADSMDELKVNIKDALDCHYGESARPQIVRLHFVHEEVLTYA